MQQELRVSAFAPGVDAVVTRLCTLHQGPDVSSDQKSLLPHEAGVRGWDQVPEDAAGPGGTSTSVEASALMSGH